MKLDCVDEMPVMMIDTQCLLNQILDSLLSFICLPSFVIPVVYSLVKVHKSPLLDAEGVKVNKTLV